MGTLLSPTSFSAGWEEALFCKTRSRGTLFFRTRVKWVMIKRSFYKDAAVVRVAPQRPVKFVFPSHGATEGRWLKRLIFPMSREYRWQVQSCLFACCTGERALNRLERWHGSDVPSPQLDGAVVEMFPSCPAGGKASAWWSEQRSPGQQLPKCEFCPCYNFPELQTRSTSSRQLSSLWNEDNLILILGCHW